MARAPIFSLAVVLTGLPTLAGAVDLTGKWRIGSAFPPAAIVQITQTGSSLSIPWQLPFTGSVGATDANGFTSYQVFFTDGVNQVGFGGRVMPSGNLFDGRGAVFFPPNFPEAFGLVATRCGCDDGNSDNGDGCDAACQVEECWTCVGDPSVCTPTLDGGVCDDHSPCTTGETCTSAVCGGGAPVSPCFDMDGPWSRHHFVPGLGIESHSATIVIQRDTDLLIDSYVGAIDPLTGAFNVRSPSPHLFCFFNTLSGVIAGDGLTYSASGSTFEPDPFAPDHCLQFAVTETGDHCGDANFDGLEQCDDGNLLAGDGCSPLCQVEPCWMCSGAPSTCVPVGGGSCDDGNGCTINDSCAGDGSCAGTPDTGATCDDDNICTMDDACTGDGGCTGAPVDCGQCHTCDVALGCVVQYGPCDDGDLCTTGDSCAGDGTCSGTPLVCEPCFACGGSLGCVLEPQPVCKASTAPEKSIVQFKNDAGDSNDRFLWLWNKGADTTLSELGNPPEATLCVYDESTATTALLFRATIPASPPWAATASGFLFKDAAAGAEGISLAQLKSGVAGKAKAKVKGKGTHLSDRPYPLPAPALSLPLRVQLQGEGGLCLETRHDSSGVLRNDPGVFKAKGVP